MKSSERFIMKPVFNNLAEAGLHYKDILVYLAIRSFYNIKDKYCYPSYQTIAKRAGVGARFVSESVKRLEAAGFIDIWKVGKGRVTHYYKFPEQERYQRVPYSLLEDMELTVYEKSMLLVIAEYCDSDLVCSKTITEIAELSGQTYRIIDRQLQALILKGYIVEELIEESATKTISRVIKLTTKITWLKNMNVKVQSVGKPEFDVNAIITMASRTIRGY